MLNVYTQNKKIDAAREFFDTMPERNLVSWNAMLFALAHNGELDRVECLFAKMPQSNVVSQTTLLSAYSIAGEINQAEAMFDEMSERNEITWNTLIEGHAQNGYTREAAELLYLIPHANVVLLWSAMISAHARKRDLKAAKETFDAAPERNHPTWNAMLAAFSTNGLFQEAKKLFALMPAKDRGSWMCFVQALCLIGEGDQALNELLQMPISKSVVEWTVMLNACCKAGDVAGAKRMYDQMTEPDVVAVNAMLAAYVRGGFFSAASDLFSKARNVGKVDLISSNIMISVHTSSGSCEEARSQLESFSTRDVHSWTALIQGYHVNGLGTRGLQAFSDMLLDGVLPNEVTLISVLNATGCSDESKKIFCGMASDFGVSPGIEHYDCMVGLLGREKRLAEAVELVESMPFGADARMWMTLLACCKKHGDMSYGEFSAGQLLRLEPENATAHAMLGEIYQKAGRTKEFLALKKALRVKGLSKLNSCSWIQIEEEIQRFCVGSHSHPCMERVYDEVERLTRLIKGEAPSRRAGIHSEKLAAAYGMLELEDGTNIFITNNLKMCGDCHEWAKLVSGAANRKLVVRDLEHLHHFENGSCSCGD